MIAFALLTVLAAEPPPSVIEALYAGGLVNGWLDYGWAPRELGKGPAKLDLSNGGGWIMGKPGNKLVSGGLRFRVRAADAADLEVRVEGKGTYPRVSVGELTPVREVDGWVEYFAPMSALNPRGAEYDQVVFAGKRKTAPFPNVELDQIGLTAPVEDVGALADALEVKLSVDCKAKGRAISPYIYGVAYDVQRAEDDTVRTLGATIRRWGGNNSSRYNWKLGNAWNTAADYFFFNVDYIGQRGYTYETFFAQQHRWGLKTALTIPTLGWVAKDLTSASYARTREPNQQTFAWDHPYAGNGKAPNGTELPPPPPEAASVAAPPAFMGEWVGQIRFEDNEKKRDRAVQLYFLDNEPALWSETHRDVHPKPLTYDELWEKTVSYATAIRKADPEAVIAGPCEWGWSNYLYSKADLIKGNTTTRPDRKAHGDLPLIAWWLKKAAEHEKKTGERLIDVVDLHFYPQGKNIGVASTGGTDPATNALRIRGVRSLWDPTYKDESWINDTVRLLPRMREWIDQYYPGRGISIGEYSFGADTHPSGGIAQAEALGRFGQEGATYAFVWYYPPKSSPAGQAFKAFRDYDGKGAQFLDTSVATTSAGPVSLFASKDAAGKMVLIAVNKDPEKTASASIQLDGCGGATPQRVFQTVFGARGREQLRGSSADKVLPPYSITVIELQPQ